MNVTKLSLIAGIALLALTAGCGGGGARTAESGFAGNLAGVDVTGRVADRGTRGSILVFAYTDLAPNDDPSTHEPASVGTLASDGAFEFGVPPAPSLTLVFLADGANDGAVDQGDPIAVLASPDLTDLQAGDRVQISDAKIDFRARRVAATVEVLRIGAEPSRTPTPAPQ